MNRCPQWSAVVLVCLSALTAWAGPPKLRVTLPAPEAVKLDKLVRVLAPGSRCAAVSEVTPTLVVGSTTPDGNTYLAAWSLDAQGQPAAQPTKIDLKPPASLATFWLVPNAIAAHPRLPLIYVWVDINTPVGKADIPPADVVYREVDHLLIYRINGPNLDLVKATARGDNYCCNIPHATLCVDASPTAANPEDRLYVPQLQKPNNDPEKTYSTQFGYVTLGPDGLPAQTGDALNLTTWLDRSSYPNVERPLGLVPLSKKIVMYGAVTTILGFVLERPGVFVAMATEEAAYPRICAHPTQPVVYGASLNTSIFHAVEHVDGFPTQLPQKINATELYTQSPPIMDTKAGKLLIGSHLGVHLIDLDANGWIKGTQQRVNINQYIRALTYTAKFDRIYVPVEKLE